MSKRKPVEDGCTGGINCPVPEHTETVSGRGGRWTFRHKPLTQGQKRTLHERNMAEMKAAQAWKVERFGPRDASFNYYGETHWTVASVAYREHLRSIEASA